MAKVFNVWFEGMEAAVQADQREHHLGARGIKALLQLHEAAIDLSRALPDPFYTQLHTGGHCGFAHGWSTPSSKQGWCRIPYEDQSLFSNQTQ